MTDKEKFIDAYLHGWYDHGRNNGIYLWDIELHSYDGEDKAMVKEVAAMQWDRLQK